jgi:hypothetical protein
MKTKGKGENEKKKVEIDENSVHERRNDGLSLNSLSNILHIPLNCIVVLLLLPGPRSWGY